MQSLNNCMNIFRRMLKMAYAPGCHSLFLVRAKTSSAPCHPLPPNLPVPRESAKRAVKSVGACLLTCSPTCKAVAIPGAPRRACPARPTCTHVPHPPPAVNPHPMRRPSPPGCIKEFCAQKTNGFWNFIGHFASDTPRLPHSCTNIHTHSHTRAHALALTRKTNAP